MGRFSIRSLILVVVVSFAFAITATSAHAAYSPPADYRVGVIYSQSSQGWVDRYNRGYGILEKQLRVMGYLQGRGWNVEWVYDKDLENPAKLAQYDVIVATYVFAMSPQAARTVTQYVADGGGFVVLFASPRVAPGVGGSERDDHWVYIMNHQGWEWGPPSEAYQTYFIDDVGAFQFFNRPAAADDPVVTGAASILRARGLSSLDMSLFRNQAPGAWIEYVRLLQNNNNAVQFMNLTQLTRPNLSTNYSIVNGAGGVRTTYLKGRTVYFYHSIADYLLNQDDSGHQTVSTGVRQLEIAGAWVESAILWAGGSGGRPGVLVRDGRTYASINVYQDGIYAHQFIHNPGNVCVTGTMRFRVFDPSGRLVSSSTRYKIGVEPGAKQRYAHSYVTRRLAAGTYRVEVEYVTTYPDYQRRYVEHAFVQRGQGKGIRTSLSPLTSGQVVFDPRVQRHAGSDRFATSLAIAKAAGGYPRPGGYVVIAGGDGADALVASGIAGAHDAPLILTRRDSIPAATEAWLRNAANGFDKAVIVGGRSVVSSAVEDRLKAIFGNADVTRLAGDDRFETSAKVASEIKRVLGPSYDGGIIVTNGSALADAAAGSAIAYGRRWPILYVQSNQVPPMVADTISAITGGAPKPAVWVAGGTSVVAPEVETFLRDNLGLPVTRAAGTNRFETSIRLADLAASTGATWRRAGIASGINLADALCLGSYVGRFDGLLFLTNGRALNVATSNRIKENNKSIEKVAIGGGSAVVAHDVSGQASGLLP